MKNISIFWKIVKWFFLLLMIAAGLMHFLKPLPYISFVPKFLPEPLFIVYLSGFVELLLGLGLLFKNPISSKAALGILILMLIFLPLHTWDLFKSQPAIGSHTLAYIRFPIQLLLIYLSYNLYRKISTS